MEYVLLLNGIIKKKGLCFCLLLQFSNYKHGVNMFRG